MQRPCGETPEQVFNARTNVTALASDDAAADAVKAAWEPWSSGQAVPLLWERDGWDEE